MDLALALQAAVGSGGMLEAFISSLGLALLVLLILGLLARVAERWGF